MTQEELIADLRNENARLKSQLASYATDWHKIEKTQKQLECAVIGFNEAMASIRAAGLEVTDVLKKSIEKIQAS